MSQQPRIKRLQPKIQRPYVQPQNRGQEAPRPFDPDEITSDAHSCGPYHACYGRGSIAVTDVVAAIERYVTDGRMNVSEYVLRGALGLPPAGTQVIGVHVTDSGYPIENEQS